MQPTDFAEEANLLIGPFSEFFGCNNLVPSELRRAGRVKSMRDDEHP